MIDYLGVRVVKYDETKNFDKTTWYGKDSFKMNGIVEGTIYHLFYYPGRVNDEVITEYERIILEKNIRYSKFVAYGAEEGNLFFGFYDKIEWKFGDEVDPKFLKEIRKHKLSKINDTRV